MAEAFKEFVNKNITAADLAADNQSITLFTNDTNKQAIVRDISINSGQKIDPTKAKLFIGNQIVLDSFQNATGSLLVDSGQSLVLKLNTPLTTGTNISIPVTLQAHTSGAGTMTYREYTINLSSGTNTDYETGASGAPVVAGTDYSSSAEVTGWANTHLGSSYYGPIYRNSSGKWYGYYTDSNSVANLRYNHSGSSGSWTQMASTSYSGPAFAWEAERMYLKDSSTLYYYDVSGTSTSSTSAGSTHNTNTTYQRGAAVAVDGLPYYYWNYHGSGHGGWFKKSGEPSYYIYMNGNNWGNNMSSAPNLILAYNSDESQFYMFQFNSNTFEASDGFWMGTIKKSIIDGASSANQGVSEGSNENSQWDTIVANQRFSDTFGTAPIQQARSQDFTSIGGKYVAYPVSATQHRIMECKNKTVSEVAVVDIPFINNGQNHTGVSYSALYGGGAHSTNNVQISSYSLDSQVRITGVEIS